LAWAPVPEAASLAVTDLMYAAIGFLVLVGGVLERDHVRWLVTAFVIGATLSVLYGALQGGGAVVNEDGRFQAGSGDPNYLAAVLVPAITLALALCVRASALKRSVLVGAVLMLVGGVAATQSRGGLIALAVAAAVALVIWRGRRLAV